MFENYERAKKRKAPKWAMPLVIVGLIVHVAMLMTMWIKSIWDVEKIELPKGRVSIGGFAPPPPPPPLRAGKKPDDAKKPKEPPKRKVMDTVQPTVPQKQVVESAPGTDDLPECPPGGNCDENAPDGGSADGIDSGIPQPNPEPAPPPKPVAPQNVAPTAVEANRISGEKMIQPDDVTKTEIGRSGKAKIVASYKICLSASGSVNSVTQLKSSGFPAYDSKLQREMKSSWKYRPFMVNGKAAPVCTAVTFIYSQKS